MATITVNLPEDVAMQLAAEPISKEQLNEFLAVTVKAWLMKRQAVKQAQSEIDIRSWSGAFQDSAVTFVDQLIEENRELFEELARLLEQWKAKFSENEK